MSGNQYDGASLFSGGGFMPSQATQSMDSFVSSAKTRGSQCLLPLTVKQISEAYQSSDDKSNFVVDGVEVNNITLLGLVTNKAERITDVSFSLDDGTGKIDVIRWVQDATDSNEMAIIENGMYVRVNGHLKGFQGKKQAAAFSVRPVTDFNEIAYHFIECIYVHQSNKLQQSQGNVAPNSYMNSTINAPSHNEMKGFQNPASNQFSVKTSGTGDDLYTMVLRIFEEPANIEREIGVHLDEVVARLRVPMNKIREAIQYHEETGNIYSTIDEFHYKSARNG